MKSTLLALCVAVLATFAPRLVSAEITEELATEMRPLVESGLASEDVAVQAWAVRAAALLGDDALIDEVASQLENVNVPVRLSAAVALLRVDERVADARQVVVTELSEGDAATRELILSRFVPAMDEDDALEIVADALDGAAELDTYTQIVRWLAQRTDGAMYALLERAPDEPADRRQVIVDEVQRASRPIGTSIAGVLLSESDTAMRLQGAEIAFAINNVEARDMLEPLLDADAAELAQRVGFHLASYGNPSALSRVAELALNAEMPEDLRMDAMATLRDHGAQLVSFSQLQAVLEEGAHSAEFVTRVHELMGATASPEALAYLQGKVDGLFADERLDGISGMGYSGQSSAIPTMTDILATNGAADLRLRAAEALGNLGGDQAAQALVAQLLVERDPVVKVAVIRALGHTGSALASQPIANEFARQEVDTAMAGLDALRELGFSDVSTQIENVAVGFRDPGVRWKAVVTLAFLDPDIGRIRLLQALDRPPEGFWDDLQGLGDDLLDEIDETLLRHSNPTIREAALFRIITRTDGGYEVLRPMLTGNVSPEVRRQAIAVVTAARRSDDAELFTSLTEEPDRALRLQGYTALAELGDPANEEYFRGYLGHADVALRLLSAWAILSMHYEG